MTGLLTESPFWVVAIGLLICGVLLAIAWQTQDRRLVPVIVIGVVLSILPLVIDSLVVTDRERVKQHIYQMAYCVRNNDFDGLLRYIDPSASNAVRMARHYIPEYRFSACNVTGFHELKMIPGDPDRAVADFRVLVKADHQMIHGSEPMALRDVTLEFQRVDGDRWKVIRFEHRPIPEAAGFLGR